MVKIKVWEIDRTKKAGGYYWRDEDGEIILYNNIEHAKDAMRLEGYKESFIESGVEYHEHVEIDKSGYDLV